MFNQKSNENTRTHIELFAGCGGLSLGLHAAGFSLLFANELAEGAGNTFAHNFLGIDLDQETLSDNEKVFWLKTTFPRTKLKERMTRRPGGEIPPINEVELLSNPSSQLFGSLILGPLEILNQTIEENSQLKSTLQNGLGTGVVDVVSGGPPCQSFSMVGLRERDNSRNKLPWEFVKFVKSCTPKIALLENVSGILRPFVHDGVSYHAGEEVAKAFCEINYIPICMHVNAKQVGAAQNRPRFILIAIRKDYVESLLSTKIENQFRSALLDSLEFYQSSKPKAGPTRPLKVHNSEKGDDLFSSALFSSLVSESPNTYSTVRDAIADLEDRALQPSGYVQRINSFPHPSPEKLESTRTKNSHEPINHKLPRNGQRVRARFRLYQLLNEMSASTKTEVRKFLRSQIQDEISIQATDDLLKQRELLLPADEKKRPPSNRKEVVELLDQLRSKKHSQAALLPNSPAPAALSIPDDFCHFSLSSPRTLTVREMARIQTFPDWYEFKSKTTTGGLLRRFEVPQYTQVGNAVPPLLAKALGEICKGILEAAESRIESKASTMPPGKIANG